MALESAARKADQITRKLGLTQTLTLLERAWDAEMGGWAGMARIVAIDNFSLVIEASSSPALQEITLRRKELLRKLNGHLQQSFLKDITVRVAQHG